MLPLFLHGFRGRHVEIAQYRKEFIFPDYPVGVGPVGAEAVIRRLERDGGVFLVRLKIQRDIRGGDKRVALIRRKQRRHESGNVRVRVKQQVRQDVGGTGVLGLERQVARIDVAAEVLHLEKQRGGVTVPLLRGIEDYADGDGNAVPAYQLRRGNIAVHSAGFHAAVVDIREKLLDHLLFRGAVAAGRHSAGKLTASGQAAAAEVYKLNKEAGKLAEPDA